FKVTAPHVFLNLHFGGSVTRGKETAFIRTQTLATPHYGMQIRFKKQWVQIHHTSFNYWNAKIRNKQKTEKKMELNVIQTCSLH
ncbi:MAG: hypothetical protein K2H92_05050, partial [Bacteroidaceae bacterium]|nr:hypothetical protein [Bacteroidaceae bacterium]